MFETSDRQTLANVEAALGRLEGGKQASIGEHVWQFQLDDRASLGPDGQPTRTKSAGWQQSETRRHSALGLGQAAAGAAETVALRGEVVGLQKAIEALAAAPGQPIDLAPILTAVRAEAAAGGREALERLRVVIETEVDGEAGA